MPPGQTAWNCSPATSNFLRLVRLLIQGSKNLLRAKLDSIHAPANLSAVLEANRDLLISKNTGLSEEQMMKLFPSHGNYGTSDFDLRMLIVLLKKVCGLVPPSTGWNKLPSVTDFSLEADLSRISYFRNTIYGHILDMEIDDSLFRFVWKEISGTFLRIARGVSVDMESHWEQTIEELRIWPVQTTCSECIRELIFWYDYDVAVRRSLFEKQVTIEEEDPDANERGRQDSNQTAMKLDGLDTKIVEIMESYDTSINSGGEFVAENTNPTSGASTSKGKGAVVKSRKRSLEESFSDDGGKDPNGASTSKDAKVKSAERSLEKSFSDAGHEDPYGTSTSNRAGVKGAKRSLEERFIDAGAIGPNVHQERKITDASQSDPEGSSEVREQRTVGGDPIIKSENLHTEPTFPVEQGSYFPSIAGSSSVQVGSRARVGSSFPSASDDLGQREDHIVVATANRGEGIECVLTWSPTKNRLFRPINNYILQGWPNGKFQIGYKYRFVVIDEDATLSRHPHKREDIFVGEKPVRLSTEVRLVEEQLYGLLVGMAHFSLDEVFAPGEIIDEEYIVDGTECPSAGALCCTTDDVRTFNESPVRNPDKVRWNCHVQGSRFALTASNKENLHIIFSAACERRPPEGNILVLFGLTTPREDIYQSLCRILVIGIIFENPYILS